MRGRKYHASGSCRDTAATHGANRNGSNGRLVNHKTLIRHQMKEDCGNAFGQLLAEVEQAMVEAARRAGWHAGSWTGFVMLVPCGGDEEIVEGLFVIRISGAVHEFEMRQVAICDDRVWMVEVPATSSYKDADAVAKDIAQVILQRHKQCRVMAFGGSKWHQN